MRQSIRHRVSYQFFTVVAGQSSAKTSHPEPPLTILKQPKDGQMGRGHTTLKRLTIKIAKPTDN